MPKVNPLTPALKQLLIEQDSIATVRQFAEHGLDASAVYRHVRRGEWQRPLQGVVATFSGELTRRQQLVAAWLWAGPESAIDGADACRWHGLQLDRSTDAVHVVVPAACTSRSRAFVRVRRSLAEITIGGRGYVPYVELPTAVIVAARNARSAGDAISVLSLALQRGLVDVRDLQTARERIGDKYCRGVDRALITVGVGLRSPAEKQHRDLILTSRLLPEPLWNQWVDLGDGRGPVCLDALFEEAALVSEVEGRRWHAWADQFERMHVRHERLTAAGLTAVHPTPTRIRRDGPEFLRRLERIYRQNLGRGLPEGVRLLDRPPIAA